jgi:hypothetical protein
MGVSPTGELRIWPIAPNSPDWEVGSLVTSSMAELVGGSRFREVREAKKHCTPCSAGCTTPYSLLFRGSFLDLGDEILEYYRTFRSRT